MKKFLIGLIVLFLVGCSDSPTLQLAKDQLQSNKYLLETIKIQEKIIKRIKKPSYDYLKSVTVYIEAVLPESEEEIDEEGEIVVNDGWIGTGVVVKETEDYTYILTNAHIAGRDYEEVYLTVRNGSNRRKATLISFHKYADLALIKVIGRLNNKQVIKGIATIKPQDRIFLVGHHLGRPYIYGEGVFAGYSNTSDLLQIPILFGNSGSGVFDKDGNLVGLIFGINYVNSVSYDTSHGLAINTYTIKHFLHEYGVL